MKEGVRYVIFVLFWNIINFGIENHEFDIIFISTVNVWPPCYRFAVSNLGNVNQGTQWVLKLSKIRTIIITISWWIKRFSVRNSYFCNKSTERMTDDHFFLFFFYLDTSKIIQRNHRQKWKSIWLHLKIRTPNQFHSQSRQIRVIDIN